MQTYLRHRCSESAAHIRSLCGIDCKVVEIAADEILGDTDPCGFCGRSEYQPCLSCDSHLHASRESYRWNGKYIYFCPAGLSFIAAPVSDKSGKLVGSFIAGPMVIGEPKDTVSVPDARMEEYISTLPVLTPEAVNHISAVICAVASFASGISPGISGNFIFEQEKLMNAISSEGERELSTGYPIEKEKQLCSMILTHDKAGAQNTLNELLGHIYFSSSFDFQAIKARIIELVVVLSRAVIDAGADMNEVMALNTKFLGDLDRFTTFEEMNVWLTGIVHKFIDYSFALPKVKHSAAVYRITEYINANYSQKITLDDIAKKVYLSRSYISTVFKDEMGVSLTDYIRDVRIEKSKLLLLDNKVRIVDISGLCGFDDQSYFTKVFRSCVGVTPKKYRENRGRVKGGCDAQ